MNAISVVCVAFLGLGLLGSNLQQPQGKEPQANAALPGLGDVMRGYVGQDCWIGNNANNFWVSMNEQKGTTKCRVELVGRDFLKVSGEVFYPFNSITAIYGKKP